jgi:hypothetical protein
MAQPEAKLSRQIQDALKAKYGFQIFCFKVWGNEHMLAGLPDILGCISGHFFGLEVKTPGKRRNTSARQEYVHELIRNAGGVAAVVESVEEALAAVSELE